MNDGGRAVRVPDAPCCMNDGGAGRLPAVFGVEEPTSEGDGCAAAGRRLGAFADFRGAGALEPGTRRRCGAHAHRTAPLPTSIVGTPLGLFPGRVGTEADANSRLG